MDTQVIKIDKFEVDVDASSAVLPKTPAPISSLLLISGLGLLADVRRHRSHNRNLHF